jgi:DNA-binding MarR family transcriptional regulator
MVKKPRYSGDRCSNEQMAEFWAYLDYAAFAINKAREKELRRFGLSTVQNRILVIMRLSDHEPTIGEVSRILLREHASIVNLTRKMEQNGLLRKFRDPVKKNVVRLAITEKGNQAYVKIAKRESLIRIFSLMSPEEYNFVKPFLNKMYEKALEEASIPKGIKISEVWDLVGREYQK